MDAPLLIKIKVSLIYHTESYKLSRCWREKNIRRASQWSSLLLQKHFLVTARKSNRTVELAQPVIHPPAQEQRWRKQVDYEDTHRLILQDHFPSPSSRIQEFTVDNWLHFHSKLSNFSRYDRRWGQLRCSLPIERWRIAEDSHDGTQS